MRVSDSLGEHAIGVLVAVVLDFVCVVILVVVVVGGVVVSVGILVVDADAQLLFSDNWSPTTEVETKIQKEIILSQ